MSDPVSWFVIEPGWEVVGSDGKKVGTVEEVVGDSAEDIFNGLAVSIGLERPRYVPAEQVEAITDGRVRLSLSAAEVEHAKEFEEPPASLELSSEKAGLVDRAADVFVDSETHPQPLTLWQRLLHRIFRRD